MMHDHEKSDSAIVAEKPTNKAVPTAAEPVEPRAGAKGNASQHSTHRTQGRERVSQALERVRQAARQRKKEKFTALLHHISINGLRMAFFALKRDAASGVDGLTWPTYEADLDRNLTDLHKRVHRGAAPQALPADVLALIAASVTSTMRAAKWERSRATPRRRSRRCWRHLSILRQWPMSCN